MLLSDYKVLLKDKRWKAKRLEILIRDNFTCQHCGAEKENWELQAHHITRGPKGGNAAPWECTNDCLVTLCEPCHKKETHYGNDAQRYLWKAIGQKRVNPETIRNLTKAVKDIYNVKIGPELKHVWLLKNCLKEEFSRDEIIRAITDLINTIGRRFCAHPFMNYLAGAIEMMPDLKPGIALELRFEVDQPENGTPLDFELPNR